MKVTYLIIFLLIACNVSALQDYGKDDVVKFSNMEIKILRVADEKVLMVEEPAEKIHILDVGEEINLGEGKVKVVNIENEKASLIFENLDVKEEWHITVFKYSIVFLIALIIILAVKLSFRKRKEKLRKQLESIKK